MTVPRQILPGTTYLVTRRCTQREFLLKPSPLVNEIFKYVLAVAARRYGIVLHAACVMSNHYHLVLTDPRANLPRFSQLLDSVLARALNALHSRWESFWAPSSYSAVSLETPKDVVRKTVYTLANPVLARLVAHGREWPGVWSAFDRIGAGGEILQRPEHFFSKKGTMPAAEVLIFSTPRGFASPEAFRAAVAKGLAALEDRVARRMAAAGKQFLGLHRISKQRPTDRPDGGEPRRALNPRVAAHDRWRRIEALHRRAEFLTAYREALESFRRGVRNVIFPLGTYQLRVHLAVACRAA